MADAHGSGPCARKGVGVQLPPSPPGDLGSAPGRARTALRRQRYAPGWPFSDHGSSSVRVALVPGSGGLMGWGAARHFAGLGLDVVGIDNDMRQRFFGPEASTAWNVARLTGDLGPAYSHHDVDIRD